MTLNGKDVKIKYGIKDYIKTVFPKKKRGLRSLMEYDIPETVYDGPLLISYKTCKYLIKQAN